MQLFFFQEKNELKPFILKEKSGLKDGLYNSGGLWSRDSFSRRRAQ